MSKVRRRQAQKAAVRDKAFVSCFDSNETRNLFREWLRREGEREFRRFALRQCGARLDFDYDESAVLVMDLDSLVKGGAT